MIDSTIKIYATRAAVSLVLAASLMLALTLIGEGDARSASPISIPIRGMARVIDGDTISINEMRIRLEGIDAPEAGQSCGGRWVGSWACGQAAATELALLTQGHEIQCEGQGHDKYGRVLALCSVDGLDINAEMVRRGMAWAFVRYSTLYVAVETEARNRKVGIWQGEAQPAWEYRANRWASAETAAPQGCAIKGNITKNGRIYHMPWSPWYEQIKINEDNGKRWFCSESEAVAAGWRPVQVH